MTLRWENKATDTSQRLPFSRLAADDCPRICVLSKLNVLWDIGRFAEHLTFAKVCGTGILQEHLFGCGANASKFA